MVVVHVKRDTGSLFLLDACTATPVQQLLEMAVLLHNAVLRLRRLCSELESLCELGAALPPDMVGLLEEQVQELKLSDEWTAMNQPSGGYTLNRDPCGRRNGQQPTPKMQEVLTKTIAEAKGMISTELVKSNRVLTEQHVTDCLSMLRGAVTIVYPMGLPPYDVILQCFDEQWTEYSSEMIEPSLAQLWFAGKELQTDKKLQDYFGKNEKTKVIVKLSRRGAGAPSREPLMDETTQLRMMAAAHRRQHEMNNLEGDSDNSYLNSRWADSKELQKQFHGLESINFKPH